MAKDLDNGLLTNLSIITEKLFTETTKEGTPFDKALKFLEEERENRTFDAKAHAETIASVMSGIVNSTNDSVLSAAINLLKFNEVNEIDIAAREHNRDILKANKEVAEGTKQYKIDNAKWQEQVAKENATHAIATTQYKNDTVKWQEKTAEQNYLYAKEKAKALPLSIDFNNKVKALDSVSDLFGNHKLGGGVITSNMWKVPLGIIDQLVNKSEEDVVIPTDVGESSSDTGDDETGGDETGE